jgi:cystathionine beta-lyase
LFIFIYNGLPILSRFQKIAEMAHAHGALVLVDNSILSPVLSQPLELGAGMANALWL